MTIFELIDAFPPINGLAANSFARFTIQRRLPSILDNVIKNHEYPSEVSASLQELKDIIINGTLGVPLRTGTDIGVWDGWMSPYQKMSWFEAPFYIAEAYFYRLINDKTGFFNHKIDPFKQIKEADIRENTALFTHLLTDLQKLKKDDGAWLRKLLMLSLWGNKSDLSQLSLTRQESDHVNDQHTLISDVDIIGTYLDRGMQRVDIVLDNSGVELFTDLLVAVHLLQAEKVGEVHLHTKSFPTFVSDATASDIDMLLDALKMEGNVLHKLFVGEVRELCLKDKLIIASDLFWNSPLHFYEMPLDLRNELGKTDLIIFKGDANYRRLFGDRQIPYDQELSSITRYLPAKSIAIRILKSEIVLGVKVDVIPKLFRADKNWATNGRYGMIQMLN